MYRTLIVEDNDPFRTSLRDLLCSRFPQMIIDEAVDGDEALRKVAFGIPDIVLMDTKLPGGNNGFAVTEKLKAKLNEVTVILLTTYDMPEYEDAAYRSGAKYCFGKYNTTAEELVSTVELILARRRGEPNSQIVGLE